MSTAPDVEDGGCAARGVFNIDLCEGTVGEYRNFDNRQQFPQKKLIPLHGFRLSTALQTRTTILPPAWKIAYRRRLSELREEFEAAKKLGNVARAEQAEQAIDALKSPGESRRVRSR